MYYKITNQACEVYQKLHALRTREKEIEQKNIKTIQDKTGMTWNRYLGDSKQQQFRRVAQYSGFEFVETEKIDPKVWKKHKDHPFIWVPNQRIKAGREMHSLLLNGLKSSSFAEVFEILGTQRPLRFIFPYVEICGEVIILFLDDEMPPKDPNVVEITSREFDKIIEREEVTNA